jgi:hypothetical protein
MCSSFLPLLFMSHGWSGAVKIRQAEKCTYYGAIQTNKCARRVNLLVYSLSLHRHSYIGFILAFASSIHNKQNKLSHRHSIVYSFEFLHKYRYKISMVHPSCVNHILTFTIFDLINLVFIFRCSSFSWNPVYPRYEIPQF